jgi:hypothetical protein
LSDAMMNEFEKSLNCTEVQVEVKDEELYWDRTENSRSRGRGVEITKAAF